MRHVDENGRSQGRARRMAGGLLLALVTCLPAAEAARQIQFKMIDGSLCAACTLRGPRKAIPANVVIDLGLRFPMLSHKNAAKLLQIGAGTPATVEMQDVSLAELRVSAVDLPVLDDLCKEHAPELGEVPAVAVLGLPAFENYVLQLEVGQGTLRLMSPQEAEQLAPVTANDSGRSTVLGYEEQGSGYWLTASAADGFKLRTRFMTSQYDTTIDAVVADLAGSAGGAIDELHLGSINIARFVALRPEDLSGLPEPKADLLIGNALLAHFRVTIDPARHRITFQQTREPQFPTEERAYFMARAEKDAPGVEKFLQAHLSSRLASEASETLLTYRLEEEPLDRQAVRRALQFRADTTVEDRRAMGLITLADALIAGGQADQLAVAVDALEIGKRSATADLNGVAGALINARLGRIAYLQGDLTSARRHLLSAAFGMPRDPLINLWLGELYEKAGKPLRAWSRFIQAALDKHPPPEAMKGLDRLNRDAGFRSRFSMQDAEQLLEGRVPQFAPSNRLGDLTAASASVPACLVELFTCIDDPTTAAPELAFGGLDDFYEGLPVALVQYHLAVPAADPLVTDAATKRAAFYQTTTAPAAFFDGQGPLTAAGGEADASAVHDAYAKAALGGPGTARSWKVGGSAVQDGGVVKGHISVSGPQDGADCRLHVVVCEKAVMVPGGNGLVLHRHVARGMLSPADGFPIPAGSVERSFDVQVSLAELTAELDRKMTELEKQLGVSFLMKPALVDSKATELVAFVQDSRTRQVRASCMLVPTEKGKTSP